MIIDYNRIQYILRLVEFFLLNFIVAPKMLVFILLILRWGNTPKTVIGSGLFLQH